MSDVGRKSSTRQSCADDEKSCADDEIWVFISGLLSDPWVFLDLKSAQAWQKA